MPDDHDTWTDHDVWTTWRRWAGWKHRLDDDEVLPFHLRAAEHYKNLPQPPRTLPPRPRPRQIKPNPDDEEPSPVRVPMARVTRTGWGIAALVVSVCVIAGLTIRTLMGAP